MLPARLLFVIGLLPLATGCDRKPPTGPSGPPAPAVTSLAITGADAVLTGVSETYTATATIGDGSAGTVTRHGPAAIRAWPASTAPAAWMDGHTGPRP
jgi:hypothetical protein